MAIHMSMPEQKSAAASAGGAAARRLGQVAFAATLALLALAAVPYGSVEPWWSAAVQCGLFALGALWVIEGWLTGGWRVEAGSLAAPICGLALLAYMQALPLRGGATGGGADVLWRTVSADPAESGRVAVKLLALVVAGQVLLRYANSRRRLRALAYAVIAVGAASACFAVARLAAQGEARGFVLPLLGPGAGFGQFINKNHFALLMEMALGPALGLIFGGAVRRPRLPLAGALALIIGVALVLSNSRGGIFGMLCQMLFVAAMSMLTTGRRAAVAGAPHERGAGRGVKPRLALAALAAAAVPLLVGAVAWVGNDPVASNLGLAASDFTAQGGDININRRDMWLAAWRSFAAHPALGSGLGGFWLDVTEHHDAPGTYVPRQAHNDYLELLAGGGVVGGALGAWFIYAFVRRARSVWRGADRERRALSLGGAAGLVAVAAHAALDFGLHVTANSLVCVALVVLAVARVKADDTPRGRRRRRRSPDVPGEAG